jgi:hypothetical protein
VHCEYAGTKKHIIADLQAQFDVVETVVAEQLKK